MSILEFGGYSFSEVPSDPAIPSSDNSNAVMPDNSETEIQMMETYFSPKELDSINSFCEQIDIMNHILVAQYGESAQKKIAKLSDTALEEFCETDTSSINTALTTLLQELDRFSNENMNFTGKNTWQTKRLLSKTRSQFNRISVQVSATVDILEEHQLILMQDISTLNKFYNRILSCFKELSMYLLAGKKRLKFLRETKLISLQKQVQANSNLHTSQLYQDFSNACDRFEKKLYDLQLSQNVAIQMAAQVRLLQNNDSILLENIQNILVNTIPLWKNQMLIALGLAHSVNAIKVQNEIKIGTLPKINQLLIDTISEVKQLQHTGNEERKNAEIELKLLEGEIKQKISSL